MRREHDEVFLQSQVEANLRVNSTESVKNELKCLREFLLVCYASLCSRHSRGTSGSDENISGAKIQPLNSETKEGVPLDQSSRGVVGTDSTIDQARINPFGGRG